MPNLTFTFSMLLERVEQHGGKMVAVFRRVINDDPVKPTLEMFELDLPANAVPDVKPLEAQPGGGRVVTFTSN
jgi:hypothetical protein